MESPRPSAVRASGIRRFGPLASRAKFRQAIRGLFAEQPRV
jgi:hypothetical protein